MWTFCACNDNILMQFYAFSHFFCLILLYFVVVPFRLSCAAVLLFVFCDCAAVSLNVIVYVHVYSYVRVDLVMAMSGEF